MSKNGKKLLSVTEFAERVGKSRQAIYKQLENNLKGYVKHVGGKTYIHVSAAEEVYGVNGQNVNDSVKKSVNLDKTASEIDSNNDKRLDDTEDTQNTKRFTKIDKEPLQTPVQGDGFTALQAEYIESLKEQIRQKDMLILELQKQNKEQHETLTRLLDQEQQLGMQLHRQLDTLRLEAEETKGMEDPEKPEADPGKKKSLFKKMFRK